MKQRQTTHNNHTVPRFYLRRWSNNGSTVNCYHAIRHDEKQKLWTSMPIKKATVWRDIYTQVNNGHDDDSIELFFQECEDKASTIIEAIELGHNINEEEIGVLVDFAITQMVRTPQWIVEQNNTIANIFGPATKEVIQKLHAEVASGNFPAKDTSTEEQLDFDSTPFPPPPLGFSLDEKRMEVVSTLSVGQQSSLFAIGRTLKGSVAKIMQSYSWVLLETKDGNELPTSDDPFVRLKIGPAGRYSIRCGVGVQGALLFMPITPHHLLATVVGNKKLDSSFLESTYAYEYIYRSIVENADRYIFSKKRNTAIESIRPSVVNPDYLQDLDEAKKNWLGT